jgi:hypothetical protein
MPRRRNQAVKCLRKSLPIKRRMLETGATVRSLARKLDHDESVISKAINHDVFPRVRVKIMEALHV